MSSPLSRTDLEAAIVKYGPILFVHPSETFQPCSVEWFLSHATLIDTLNPTAPITHPSPAQLPQGPAQGSRYYLSIEDSVRTGNFSTAKAYINAFWKPDLTFTDIQFWIFNAYNGPGTARFASLVWNKVEHVGDVDLAPLGEHVGDWEYVVVRIDNSTKEMIGIMLSQHGKDVLFDKQAIASNFKFVGGTHPIVYASLNGHANFARPGPNFTEHRKVLGIPAGLEFNLLNLTADGGNTLDFSERFEIVAANWLNGTPDAYTSPSWVGYMYRWGPEGTTIRMDTRTLGDFIKAALGDDAQPLVDSWVVLLASELLNFFVKANINGVIAPATHGQWIGNYSL